MISVCLWPSIGAGPLVCITWVKCSICCVPRQASQVISALGDVFTQPSGLQHSLLVTFASTKPAVLSHLVFSQSKTKQKTNNNSNNKKGHRSGCLSCVGSFCNALQLELAKSALDSITDLCDRDSITYSHIISVCSDLNMLNYFPLDVIASSTTPSLLDKQPKVQLALEFHRSSRGCIPKMFFFIFFIVLCI